MNMNAGSGTNTGQSEGKENDTASRNDSMTWYSMTWALSNSKPMANNSKPAGWFLGLVSSWLSWCSEASPAWCTRCVRCIRWTSLILNENDPTITNEPGVSWLHLASKSTESTVQSQCSDVAWRSSTVRHSAVQRALLRRAPVAFLITQLAHWAHWPYLAIYISRACQSLTALPISTHAVCLELV